jgi:hypothetical protein
MVLDNKNEIPVLGIVYLAFLFIVVTGYMFGINYGWVGVLATIVVIVGAVLLILKLWSEASG